MGGVHRRVSEGVRIAVRRLDSTQVGALVEMSLEEGVRVAHGSLVADRLSILVGAGLSMAAPSSLPAAWQIAASAKAAYEARFGPAPFGNEIAEQADYFVGRAELATVYLRTLVDKNAFAGPPNAGHYAVADLILVGALQTAVTTNIDTMIETAGQWLFGHIETGVDDVAMSQVPARVTPLLKLHGCRQFDLATTVWSQLQLAAPPVSTRIAGNAAWLTFRLANQDLLVVGYSTDWDYLNQVLRDVVGTVAPATVIIVNPLDAAGLAARAPHLMALGTRASVRFIHIRHSGDEFLAALRRAFCVSFIRQVLHGGRQDFQQLKGVPPDPNWLEPPTVADGAYIQIRRDLEGCAPREVAKQPRPQAGSILGLTLLQLRAAGAVADGSTWLLAGHRVRVVRAEGKALHAAEAAFARESAPIVAPDIVIAVGADDLGLKSNVVRGASEGTITRGASSRWMLRTHAEAELHL